MEAMAAMVDMEAMEMAMDMIKVVGAVDMTRADMVAMEADMAADTEAMAVVCI